MRSTNGRMKSIDVDVDEDEGRSWCFHAACPLDRLTVTHLYAFGKSFRR